MICSILTFKLLITQTTRQPSQQRQEDKMQMQTVTWAIRKTECGPRGGCPKWVSGSGGQNHVEAHRSKPTGITVVNYIIPNR